MDQADSIRRPHIPHTSRPVSRYRHFSGQGVGFGAVEGLALGCAMDLQEAAVAGAGDVHVGLGLDIFLVVEVEHWLLMYSQR